MITLYTNQPDFKAGEMEYKGLYANFHTSTAKAELIASAEAELSVDHYYELRGTVPVNYGRSKRVAWYWENGMRCRPLADLSPPAYDVMGGYYVFSGRRTPGGPVSSVLVPGGHLIVKNVAEIMENILADGPDSGQTDCSNCKHSWYDHIGWRPIPDKKTFCRIAGCRDCPGYAPSHYNPYAP